MIATASVKFEAATVEECVALMSTWVLTPGAEVTVMMGQEVPQPPQVMMVNVTAEPLVVSADGAIKVGVVPEIEPQ